MVSQSSRITPYHIFVLIALVGICTISLLYIKQAHATHGERPGIVASPHERGDIFLIDKDGRRYLAATTHVGYNLNISPLELGDTEEIYEHLSEVIPLEKATFFSKAKKSNDQYETLQKDLSDELKEEIEEKIQNYRFSGVWLEKFKKRQYVRDSLAAHVVGFVSSNAEGETKGLYGVEQLYDDVLRVSTDEQESSSKLSTGNIVLTLDVHIQRELEKALAGVMETWGADHVGGVVIDPQTGRLYALAAAPTFDPNNFGEETDYAVFNNPVVENVYELGSIFKPLTIAVGLDSGRVDKDFVYNDTGSIDVGIETISNHDKKGNGPGTTLQQILSKSLNTGSVSVLLETGIDTYRDYLEEFRFDGITQIDLPKEIAGLTSNLQHNREIEYATASFGQGIAITPIAAVRALSALANGGVLVQPYLLNNVETIRLADVEQDAAYTRERKRIFKQPTTEHVTKLLEYAYDFSLAGGKYRKSRYGIAAKTGTAQVVDPKSGEYAEEDLLHSFFGYFPTSEPRFLVFLFASNLAPGVLASETLAQPFSDLVDHIISYYHIPPDR